MINVIGSAKAAVQRLLIIVFVGAIFGCSPKVDTAKSSSKVVATVNGEIITQDDVNFLLQKLMSGVPATDADSTLQKKIVDSLIASKAMTIKVKAQLSEAELKDIEQASKNFEEELYVKAYLQKNITPEPVTGAMVKAYYEQNPEQFGAHTTQSFQILKLDASASEEVRNNLLAHVVEIKADKDWGFKKALYEKRFGLTYQEGNNLPGLLNEKLSEAISKLGEKQTSNVLALDDGLYLVRVVKVESLGPKALSLVSSSIRKTLAAKQLKTAVKKATEESLTGLSVKKDF